MKKKIFKLLILFILILVVASHKKILGDLYPQKFKKEVLKYSRQYNIDENLVFSIIEVESDFNPNAKSHKNALGLMQITLETGRYIAGLLNEKDFTEDKLFNPEINIKYGCFYISKLYKTFDGDTDCMLAAYNGGEGNVRKWLKLANNNKLDIDNIPFVETKIYIKRVKFIYKIYNYIYGK